MKKAIDLQAQIATSGNKRAASAALEQAFTEENPGMRLTVKEMEDSGAGSANVKVYIQGEQRAAADFEGVATQALQKAINKLQAAGVGVAGTHVMGVSSITAVENDEEDIDVILPPATATPSEVHAMLGAVTARSHQKPSDVPAHHAHPKPPPNGFQGCPSKGFGGDPQLNTRKNRIDSGDWIPIQLSSILELDWPPGVEGKDRSQWTQQEKKDVARFEGMAVQVEGFLAGAKVEGPESCNCNADKPNVDYHLWIVVDAHTTGFRDPQTHTDGRKFSVVAEVTPRVRAIKPKMDINHIKPLVDGKTKIRVSGWLLLDPAHPDQIGHTRATIWEVHPIVEFEVFKNNQWVVLGS